MSRYYFASNSNLINAVALWFSDNTSALSTYGDISTWDVSNITSMYQLFRNKSTFNDDITSWDVGKVTNMYEMFRGCDQFNQDIGGWNTSNVTNMRGMFQGARVFNKDIGGWDTGNVTDMSNMFRDATNFDQNLTNWRVKKITYLPSKFNGNSGLTILPVWGNNIVTNVTSSLTNGTYNDGDVIPIIITLLNSVTVTNGTPRIELETGTTNRYATYSSGSGTDTLTFNYTVESGDSTTILEYASTTSLELNNSSGSLSSISLNLPFPGSSGSLSTNKSLEIDTISPTVTNVTSSLADGVYNVGQAIPIDISFSEIVNVVTTNGFPTIQLETGTTDRYATYSSGSGTDTLTFEYIVQSGDTSTKLSYTSTSSLELNSGTIEDAAGNSAGLVLFSPGSVGSLSANKSLEIDTTGNLTPPIPLFLRETYPLNNSNNIAFDIKNIIFEFSKAIYPKTGGTILVQTNNQTIERIDANDNKKVSGNGSDTIVITPETAFEPFVKYDIAISNKVFKDYNGTKLSFTTNDEKLPTLLSHVPEQNASNVSKTQSIILRFSQPIHINPKGSIVLYNSYNDKKEYTINLESGEVIGSETNEITINLIKKLLSNTPYYILISYNTFHNDTNNYYEGITDKTAFRFTTGS